MTDHTYTINDRVAAVIHGRTLVAHITDTPDDFGAWEVVTADGEKARVRAYQMAPAPLSVPEAIEITDRAASAMADAYERPAEPATPPSVEGTPEETASDRLTGSEQSQLRSWGRIAGHPVFAPCIDRSRDLSLLDAMMQRLDDLDRPAAAPSAGEGEVKPGNAVGSIEWDGRTWVPAADYNTEVRHAEKAEAEVQRVMVASHRYASDREDLQQEVEHLRAALEAAEAVMRAKDTYADALRRSHEAETNAKEKLGRARFFADEAAEVTEVFMAARAAVEAERCTGAGDCAVSVHVHGCYADVPPARCDDASEHAVEADTEGARDE